jgi:uncharacterized protein (PEP-CTERM system associated)
VRCNKACDVNAASGPALRLAACFAIVCLLGPITVQGFPVSDASAPSVESNPPEPTELDLRHQLQLQPGLSAAAGPGWTFVPQLALNELFTDNILNSETNRRWDLLTLFTPSILINGDVPNAQVRLNYGPQFRLAARTPQESNVTQQLLGTGQFTIIPDAFFVDVRAVSGSSALASGFGALGLGVTTPTLGPPSLSGIGTAALSKQNQVQTSSLSVAPYWLHRFGDIGMAKVGYQFNETDLSQSSSFYPLFFSRGNGSAYNSTNEVIGQFQTGDQFAPFRDLATLDGVVGNGTGVNAGSHQYFALNRLGYLLDRSLMGFGEIGYESLRFGGVPVTTIDDAVWGIGGIWQPHPESQVTAEYGHKYGANNVAVDASYALTARTRVSARYQTGLQSDLQTIRSQLDLVSLDASGQTVDSQTGAPLFIGTGGLGFQNGLFRTRTLAVTSTTLLERDQLSVSFVWSRNTTVATVLPGQRNLFGVPAPPVGSINQAETVYVTWLHQLSEAWLVSSGAAYSTSHVSPAGAQQSVAASVGTQYLFSETVTGVARYSYLNRISETPGQSFYQNVFLVGLSKSF